MKQSIQFHPGSKKLFLAIIAVITTVITSAQLTFEDPIVETKKIDLAEFFNKIEVQGDATIILTNDLTNSVVFRGDLSDMEQATARVKKGKLTINTSYRKSAAKFIIYLPAGNINSLATSGKTEIRSAGTIKLRNLELLLYGSSQVSIRHQGNLRVTPGIGYEITDGSK